MPQPTARTLRIPFPGMKAGEGHYRVLCVHESDGSVTFSVNVVDLMTRHKASVSDERLLRGVAIELAVGLKDA